MVEVVQPSGRLRKGDPLSPYLFKLCAEGLSRLLNQAEEQGELCGIRLRRGGPTMNHLFFVDDSFLFCSVNTQSTIKIFEILSTFELSLGQKVNFEKSTIYFQKFYRERKR